MPVIIRDSHFERRVKAEKRDRGHKSLAKTVQELAEERLIEMQMGQYLAPAPSDASDVIEPLRLPSTTATRLPVPSRRARPVPT